MKSKSSCSRLQPAGGLKRRTESSYVQTQRINPSQMINYSPLPWKRKPKHRIADDSKQEAESDTAFTKQDESVTVSSNIAMTRNPTKFKIERPIAS